MYVLVRHVTSSVGEHRREANTDRNTRGARTNLKWRASLFAGQVNHPVPSCSSYLSHIYFFLINRSDTVRSVFQKAYGGNAATKALRFNFSLFITGWRKSIAC